MKPQDPMCIMCPREPGVWKPAPTRLAKLDEGSEWYDELDRTLPVSMLSLTMQSPVRRMLSLGNCVKFGSLNSYKSPGTNSLDATYFPAKILAFASI